MGGHCPRFLDLMFGLQTDVLAFCAIHTVLPRAWTSRNGNPDPCMRLRTDAELERLLAAGAERVDIGQTGQEPWHVLADPEGNEFCLLRPRVDPV